MDKACEILQDICKRALKTKEGVVEISRQVNAIVTTLVPLAQSASVKDMIEMLIVANADHLDEPSKSKPAFTEEKPSENTLLKQAIQKLDPLPEAVGTTLRTAHTLRRDEGEEASPMSELVRLSTLPTPSNPSARFTRLKTIHTTLCDLRREAKAGSRLKAEDHGYNPGNYEKKQRQKSMTVDWGQLVRQLVEVCRKGDADASVVALATECLGEIPLAHVHADLTQTTRSSSQASNHGSILEMLNAYLADYDMSVVCAAADCVRAILKTDTGASALQKLKEEEVQTGGAVGEYLAPFSFKKPAKLPPHSDASAKDMLALDNLWIPTSSIPVPSLATPQSPSANPPTLVTANASEKVGGHTSWVCNLASAMSGSVYVKDDVLRLCGSMCKVRADFAEYVFPFLVHDMLINDSDKGAKVCKSVLRYFTKLLQLGTTGT